MFRTTVLVLATILLSQIMVSIWCMPQVKPKPSDKAISPIKPASDKKPVPLPNKIPAKPKPEPKKPKDDVPKQPPKNEAPEKPEPKKPEASEQNPKDLKAAGSNRITTYEYLVDHNANKRANEPLEDQPDQNPFADQDFFTYTKLDITPVQLRKRK